MKENKITIILPYNDLVSKGVVIPLTSIIKCKLTLTRNNRFNILFLEDTKEDFYFYEVKNLSVKQLNEILLNYGIDISEIKC